MEWCQPLTFWCKTLVTPKYQAPYKAGRHIFWQQLLALWFKTSCHYNWCVFILSISWSLIRIKIAVGISCQSNSFICWARHFDWTLPSAKIRWRRLGIILSAQVWWPSTDICKEMQAVHHTVSLTWWKLHMQSGNDLNIKLDHLLGGSGFCVGLGSSTEF